MRLAKYTLVCCLVVLGLTTFRAVAMSLESSSVYQRDLFQDYLVGKAALAGGDPYLPLPALAERFFPEIEAALLPHPTPHPPTIVLLAIPLATIPYKAANIVWCAVELSALGVALWILARWFGLRAGLVRIVLATLVVIGWTPFVQELAYGQLMICMLMLLSLSGYLLQQDKPSLAGIALGLALSLKLLGWPILLFLGAKRQLRPILAAGITVLVLNLLSAVILTPGVVVSYYTDIASQVTPFYQAFAFNFSPWTVGWRLFEGMGSSVLESITAPPLVYSPKLAPAFSLLALAAVTVGGLYLALRASSFSVAYGILLCVSIFGTPVTWVHYFILTLPPLVALAKRLWDTGLPTKLTGVLLLIVLVLSLRANVLEDLACSLSSGCSEANSEVSFLAGLVTYLQPLAVGGLVCLLYITDRQSWQPGRGGIRQNRRCADGRGAPAVLSAVGYLLLTETRLELACFCCLLRHS